MVGGTRYDDGSDEGKELKSRDELQRLGRSSDAEDEKEGDVIYVLCVVAQRRYLAAKNGVR